MPSDTRGVSPASAADWGNPLKFDDSGRPYKSPPAEADRSPVFAPEGSALFFPETTLEPARAPAPHGTHQSGVVAPAPAPALGPGSAPPPPPAPSSAPVSAPWAVPWQYTVRHGGVLPRSLHEDTLQRGALPVRVESFGWGSLASATMPGLSTSPYTRTLAQPREETGEESRKRLKTQLDLVLAKKRRTTLPSNPRAPDQPPRSRTTARTQAIDEAQSHGPVTTSVSSVHAVQPRPITNRADRTVRREATSVMPTAMRESRSHTHTSTKADEKPQVDEPRSHIRSPAKADDKPQMTISTLHSIIATREQKLRDYLANVRVGTHQSSTPSRHLANDAQDDGAVLSLVLANLEERDAANFLHTLLSWDTDIGHRTLLHKLDVYKSLREILEGRLAH